MIVYTKANLIPLIFALFLLHTFSGCTKKKEDIEIKTSQDSIIQQQTQQVMTSSQITKDSSDIYGTGDFYYRDSLQSFHRGYSIPRDSLYKVKNIKAFERLNFLIRKYPVRPGPYLDRGNHFQNIKMYPEAINDYDKYIEMRPSNHSAYMNRGNAHERLKHYDLAMKDYNKVLELKPNDTIAHFNRGIIHDLLGRYDSAVKEYDTVIIKDRRLAKAYYNRGTSYVALKNYTMAVKDWEEAIRLNPVYEPDLRPRINKIKPLIK